MGGAPMLTYVYNLLQWQDNNPTPFERLLRRDRVVVSIALLILILLAWLHVGRLATITDIIGTRIVSTEGRIAATSISWPWSGAEFVSMVRHVGGHDGRNDA